MKTWRLLGILLMCTGLCMTFGVTGCSDDDDITGPGPEPGPTWTNEGITWNAPYTPTGSTPSTLQYIKLGDIVHLQGMANAGGINVQEGQLVGTMPEGYRSPATTTRMLLCPTWGWPSGKPDGYIGTAGVFIFADGGVHIKTVQQYNAEQQFAFFDSKSFCVTNGWTNDGITWTAPYSTEGSYPSTIQYKKEGDIVYLQGHANAGGTNVQEGQFICTLPEGYRPPAHTTRFFLCPTWGWPTGKPGGYVGTAGVFIFADGGVHVKTVQQYNGEQQFMNLDGICFSTSDTWSNAGITWNAPYKPGGSTPSTLQYKKIGDIVYLQGMANAGGTWVQEGQDICVLPEGLRPPVTTPRNLLCPTWGWPTGKPDGYVGSAGVIIFNDGRVHIKTVQQYDGEQQFLLFDAICYSTTRLEE